jgi:LCP family protein required for cell wall assembly
MSEIERIKNGDFERGNADWYVEAGATITETDAVSGSRALVIPAEGSWVDQSFFFLPGTTYQLTTWGKVSKQGDIGLIGISYFDANGVRLNDLEPKPLSFTPTRYTQEILRFTVPDGVATAKVFIWKDAGKADFNVDDISLRSEVQPSDLEPADTATNDDAITILVMGVDARPGESIDIGVRPDSLMVLRLNPQTGSCRTLAIPRDTRTELPGYGKSKINHALAVGGIPYEQQVVENLLGLQIDHYLLIDFNGFQDLVDAVGGIQIDVPEAFAIDQDIWFDAGPQTMDGKHALAYARWRGGSDGDFGRIARQQAVLRALIRKGAGLDVIRSLNELLPAVQDNIRTDLGPKDMARLGLDYRETCTDQSVEMLRLEGYNAWFDDPLLNLQLIYVVVDEAEVSSKVRMFVEP